MSSAPRPAFVDLSKSMLRLKIAAAFLAFSAVLGCIAYRFQTSTYVITTPAGSKSQRFEKIWFDSRNALVGARTDNGILTIRRDGSLGSAREFQIPAANSAWAASQDLDIVAWIAPPHLWIRTARSESPRSIALPPGNPLTLSFLSDESLAAVFADGSVHRWDQNTGDEFPPTSLSATPLEQAVSAGDYVAAATSTEAILYRYRDGRWNSGETVPAPSSGYSLVIPAPGAMAQIAGGVLRYQGETRNTRGAVLSVVSHQGTLLTTGAFERVWVATSPKQKEEDYEIAPAAPGSVLALSSGQLAVSGPEGTATFKLGSEERLTGRGRMAAVLAFLNALVGILIALAPTLLRQFLKLFAKMLGGKAGGGGALPGATLPVPPTILIERTAASRSVLWAGAGLSMQSGYPSRTAFVTNLVNSGIVDGWLDAASSGRLQRLMGTSGTEAVMNQLSAEKPEYVTSGQIQAMIPKYSQLSRCHELLAAIPFAAAVTTNYDDMLDRMKARWTGMIVTPQSEEIPRLRGIPFLLKFYGLLGMPESLRLSRGKLAEDFPAPARELVSRVGNMNTLLFVGASLEGLLADLDALGLAEIRGGTHFAVVGTANPQWKKVADELKGRYAIEVLACGEDSIATELPKFLADLQAAVAKVQQSRREEPVLTETAA